MSVNVNGLRWKKTRARYENYKASCTFDPASLEAWSYGWWLFLARINGKIVFNNYRYSNCTSKHQSKVRQALEQLDIVPDLVFEAPRGLQDLASAEEYYKNCIRGLQEHIDKPRSHAKKNAQRRTQIKAYEYKLFELKRIQADKREIVRPESEAVAA